MPFLGYPTLSNIHNAEVKLLYPPAPTKTAGFTNNITISNPSLTRLNNYKVRVLPVQNITVTDSRIRITTRIRLLAIQNFILTDSRIRMTVNIRGFAQALGLSDNFVRSLNRIRTLVETLTLDSIVVRIRGRTKTISGAPVNLSLGKSIASFRNFGRVLSQTIGFTDSITRLRGLVNRYFTENIGPLTLASIITFKTRVRNFIEEGLSLIAENMTHAKPVRIRALANQALQFTHVNRRIANRIKSTSTQNIDITDSLQHMRLKFKSLEQSLAFSSNVVYARAITTRGFNAVVGLGSSVVYRIPNKVRLISNVLNLTSSVVKDIPSRIVEIPLISTLGEKITRPELYSSVNPISLFNRVVIRDAHQYIKKKDLDSLNKPVMKPDIPVSTPELKAGKPEYEDTDLKTKINRGRKIGRLF